MGPGGAGIGECTSKGWDNLRHLLKIDTQGNDYN